MDNLRILLWATFAMMGWMTYQAWQADYAPKPVANVSATGQAGETATANTITDAFAIPDLGSETSQAASGSANTIDAPPVEGQAISAAATSNETLIQVTTDVFDLQISPTGGSITEARLLQYPVEKEDPSNVVAMLSPQQSRFGLLQSGLNARQEEHRADHHIQYSAAKTEYTMGNQDTLDVILHWQNAAGLIVEKTLTFTRGSYQIDIRHELQNNTAETWVGADYAQIVRHSSKTERSMFDVDSYSFDGPEVYNGERTKKLSRGDLLDDGPYTVSAVEGGWLALIEHHFLSAIIPPKESTYNYRVAVRNDVSLSSAIATPNVVVEPGQQHQFKTTAFVGPKLQSQLEAIDPSLKLSVDYGWLTMISQPLFWLLSKVQSVVSNWGVAIIIVTLLIKIAFYKLTETSSRSMAKMREIQPRMKAMQERYKDDRQALGQAMMDLYKREKINPAAGCLPILLQMPFFLAFYWVLLESVEMRQAPFALWITDLSSKDPFFILPVIMGLGMLFQQRLNPMSADPVQAKVMQIMPIVFTVFFAFFPAGLVLYWITNTFLTILQQWHINRVVQAEAAARKRSSSKNKKSKKSEAKKADKKADDS